MPKLIIETGEGTQCSCTVEGKVDFELLLRMLFGTLDFCAEDFAQKAIANTTKVAKKKKLDKERLETAIRADIADLINFAVSNVLNRLSPKDPDLELSEKAIATCENIVIHYADDNKISIKEALDKIEEILAENVYAAKPSL